MRKSNHGRKEHLIARLTAKVVVLTVLACLLVAVFSGVAAAAWAYPCPDRLCRYGKLAFLSLRPGQLCLRGPIQQ